MVVGEEDECEVLRRMRDAIQRTYGGEVQIDGCERRFNYGQAAVACGLAQLNA